MTADGAAFWIDDEYDREQASDGISRYGAYVRQASSLGESWDGTWTIRTSGWPGSPQRRGRPPRDQ